jgi:hypothetical protein
MGLFLLVAIVTTSERTNIGTGRVAKTPLWSRRN